MHDADEEWTERVEEAEFGERFFDGGRDGKRFRVMFAGSSMRMPVVVDVVIVFVKVSVFAADLGMSG